MPSILPRAVRELTQQLMRLPSIGPKTARRLSLYLLRQPAAVVQEFAKSLETLHRSVRLCAKCYNLSENELCVICREPGRDETTVCIVEDALDVEAIEQVGSYKGLYHVLGGVLSPIEGIDVKQLTLEQLLARIPREGVRELIIALGHTMESDATTRYITSHLAGSDIAITRLARGLPTGGDIEFADTPTLSAALEGRKRL